MRKTIVEKRTTRPNQTGTKFFRLLLRAGTSANADCDVANISDEHLTAR
jgi:hypothetical protein